MVSRLFVVYATTILAGDHFIITSIGQKSRFEVGMTVDVSQAATAIIVAVIAAILAASLTYYYSLRLTRKAKVHDAKLEAYGKIVGLYQEALLSMDNMIGLQEINARDEESFLPNLMNLVSELSKLGDTEALIMVTDSKASAKSLKEKGPGLFIETLQARAILVNSVNMANSFREARMRIGEMLLVSPPESVRGSLREVKDTLAYGAMILLKGGLEKYQDLFADIDIPSEARTPDQWRKDVERVMNKTIEAMKADLDLTL